MAGINHEYMAGSLQYCFTNIVEDGDTFRFSWIQRTEWRPRYPQYISTSFQGVQKTQWRSGYPKRYISL